AANQIKLLGAANGSPVQIAALGASDLNVGIQLVPKGTGRVAVSANGLDVTGTLTATSTIAAGGNISTTARGTTTAGTSPLTGTRGDSSLHHAATGHM